MTRTCHNHFKREWWRHACGGFCCGGGAESVTPWAVNITSLVTACGRRGNIRLPGLLIPRPNGGLTIFRMLKAMQNIKNGQLAKSDPFIGPNFTNSANLRSIWKDSQIARDVAGGQGLQDCAETEVQLTEWWACCELDFSARPAPPKARTSAVQRLIKKLSSRCDFPGTLLTHALLHLEALVVALDLWTNME